MIDADKLIDSLINYPSVTNLMARIFIAIIYDQNIIEVPKQKVGRWIYSNNEGWECSRCWRINDKPSIYCPICGSKNKPEETT